MALWGAVTGRDDVRDLGIELHAVESAAVLQYWFDVDHAVFPDGFPYQATGMVWGDGASHTTWFSDNPEMIHGINETPIGASTSLYLATRQDEILANYAEMAAESGGAPRYWKNIQWEYLALADPGRALAALQADPNYSLDEGGSGSRAQTVHWISSLAALGTLNTEVRADTPFYAVFAKNGLNTYVAYNAGDENLVVHFTDGTMLTVAPDTMETLRDGKITVFGIGSDAVVVPDPHPGPPPEPDANGLQITAGKIGFDANLGTISLASAAGANHDGAPHATSTFSVTGVTAGFKAGQATDFALKVDAGALVGDALQMAVSYDFNGDGNVDRLEAWHYFATDNTTGWETYGSHSGLMSATGAAMQNSAGGTVTVALWTALGTHPVQVDLAASSLSLPFETQGTGTGPVPGPAPNPTPAPAPSPPTATGDGLVLADGAVGFQAGQGTVSLAASNGANHDGVPYAAASFMLEHVTAHHLASATTGFRLLVDAGAGVGNAVQAAISYDFDGNGTIDRTETYRYFATDDVAGSQVYGSGQGLQSVSGAALQDLAGGTLKSGARISRSLHTPSRRPVRSVMAITLENSVINSVSRLPANVAMACTPNGRRETLAHENTLVHFGNIHMSITRPRDNLSELKQMYCVSGRTALERSALRQAAPRRSPARPAAPTRRGAGSARRRCLRRSSRQKCRPGTGV